METLNVLCEHPIKAYRFPDGSVKFTPQGASSPLELPCGKCIHCKLAHSRNWAIRCVHENQMHLQSCFLTLTYAEENLPEHLSLQPRHLTLFLKKLRKFYSGKTIRYFACGEYGDLNQRPHYHALIFGHDFYDDALYWSTTATGYKLYTSQTLTKLWEHGLAWFGTVTFESAAYVARYITKKITGLPAWTHYGENINLETGELTYLRHPEFSRMSRRPGIGATWYDKYKTDVYPHGYTTIRNGIKTTPPRYYDKKYIKENEQYKNEKWSRSIDKAIEQIDENTPRRKQAKTDVKKAQMKMLLRNKI